MVESIRKSMQPNLNQIIRNHASSIEENMLASVGNSIDMSVITALKKKRQQGSDDKNSLESKRDDIIRQVQEAMLGNMWS